MSMSKKRISPSSPRTSAGIASKLGRLPGVRFFNSRNIAWKLNLSFGLLVALTLLVVILGAIGRHPADCRYGIFSAKAFAKGDQGILA